MTGYFPFQGVKTENDRINELIINGAKTALSDVKVLEREINKFKKSDKLKWMKLGIDYYEGNQDITNRERKVIGRGGRLETVDNLPNNKVLDNQYEKLVDQKVNYQLGKPLTIETESETYSKLLKQIFNKRFHRKLRNIGEDALNGGISYLHPYYNESRELAFKHFKGYEILVFWKDADKTEIEAFVHMYHVNEYEGDKEVAKEYADLYSKDGVTSYVWHNGSLIENVEKEPSTYLTLTDEDGQEKGMNWERIPLIPFRFNSKEKPLIKRVKSLQDGINTMLSDFQNNMEEDSRSTILVLHNYDGQDLGEFRRNLSVYGAVKVRSADGAKGGVDTLEIEVNKDNYESIIKLFKKALVENGRGYDAKDERMSNNPNQMNIQSMYSDIELDANGIETEFQASFEELLWFINVHLSNTGKADFESEEVKFIFNRDTLVNEAEVIKSLSESTDLSIETRISQHPYVDDVQRELDRIKKERQERMDEYDNYDETFRKKQSDLNGQE
ncbi:phage portal protein [Paucisalibacillus globulus]|uniref:phage portal protein n=1 Tax=Paucisalibacillus globulus TaxID=351095 RepID=UPI001C3EBFA3|nr:phage portal protein [Paucisalibacillus globulus]